MTASEEWIGVDFDRTLATYSKWRAPDNGIPIAPMVDRVKAWLASGTRVKIFTARVAGDYSPDEAERVDAARERAYIQRWCAEHVGQALPVTCVKDMSMVELWDDRAVGVVPNTGERVG